MMAFSHVFLHNAIVLIALPLSVFPLQSAPTDSKDFDVELNVPTPTQYVRLHANRDGSLHEMGLNHGRFVLPPMGLDMRNDSGGFTAMLSAEASLTGQGSAIPLEVSVCGKSLNGQSATEVLSGADRGKERYCPLSIRSEPLRPDISAGDYKGVITLTFSPTS